jgi:hypothetical protein
MEHFWHTSDQYHHLDHYLGSVREKHRLFLPVPLPQISHHGNGYRGIPLSQDIPYRDRAFSQENKNKKEVKEHMAQLIPVIIIIVIRLIMSFFPWIIL